MGDELSAEIPQETAPAAIEETSEVAETSEQAVTEESTEKVTNEAEPQSNIDKRFGQMTAKRYELEATIDRMTQERDKVEQDRQQEILNKPAPTEEQFDYDKELHDKAVQEHFYAQGQAQGQANALREVQAREAQAVQAREVSAYNNRVQEFAVKAPDFAQSVGALQVPADVQQLLMRDDQGPEMAYLASKNPEFSAKLNHFDPVIRNQGIIDIKMKIASSPKANNISSAGEPNTSQVQAGITPEKSDFMKLFPNAEIMT